MRTYVYVFLFEILFVCICLSVCLSENVLKIPVLPIG